MGPADGETERAAAPNGKTASGASKWLFEGTSGVLAFAAPTGRTLAAVSFYEIKSGTSPASPAKETEVRTVSLWEVATGEMRHEISLPVNSGDVGRFRGRPDRFVLGGKDGTGFAAWTLPPPNGSPPRAVHRDAVAALTLSPDGRTLASGSWGHRPRLGLADRRSNRHDRLHGPLKKIARSEQGYRGTAERSRGH